MKSREGCSLPITYYGDTRAECRCGWTYASAAWITLASAVISHRLGLP